MTGSVVGVADPDDVMTRISNVAHDTILPDVMPFIQIRPIEMEGKQVVKNNHSRRNRKAVLSCKRRAEAQRRVCPERISVYSS